MSIYLERDQDTICAIATPPGHGGIAIIRISGEQALTVAQACCDFLPVNPTSHHVYYGFLINQNNEKVDEVLCTYFSEKRSFTGESVVEISCHGGQFLTQSVLTEVISRGARLAEKGEFSFRAFMNGRIDLVQAESILSLIQSETKAASQLSLSHLQGELSKAYLNIEDQLIWILAHLEANIDYAQEDIQVAEESLLYDKLLIVDDQIKNLIASFHDGRKVQEGIRLSLVGLPNAGKSSLLNAILQQERSIVTDIEGTTRDFIEESFYFKNQKFMLTDTAGLRSTEDAIEKIGIQKTLEKIQTSDLQLVLLDSTKNIQAQISSLNQFLFNDDRPIIFVVNKADLISPEKKVDFKNLLSDMNHVLFTSAKQLEGISELLDFVLKVCAPLSSESSVLVTQIRHLQLLKLCIEDIQKAKNGLLNNDSPEFVIFELQSSVARIQEILGKQFDDEVMDRVFKEFCLGK